MPYSSNYPTDRAGLDDLSFVIPLKTQESSTGEAAVKDEELCSNGISIRPSESLPIATKRQNVAFRIWPRQWTFSKLEVDDGIYKS